MISVYFPNIIDLFPELISSLWETILMITISGFFSTLFGLPLGIIMLVTSKGHILENPKLYSVYQK